MNTLDFLAGVIFGLGIAVLIMVIVIIVTP
jgi:uncharacterized membrane protein